MDSIDRNGLPCIAPWSLLPFEALPLDAAMRTAELYSLKAKQGTLDQVRFVPTAARYLKPPSSVLKIGIVSADWGRAPMSRVLTSIAATINSSLGQIIEWHFYSLTDAGERGFALIDISTDSDREAAATISEAGIHILIDMNGHTKHARIGLFHLAPAPLIAHAAAYMSSAGTYASYIVTDSFATPPTASRYFYERFSVLPNSLMPPHQHRSGRLASSTRVTYPLSRCGFAFGTYSKHWKLNPQLIDIWMGILRRTEAHLVTTHFPSAAIPNLRSEVSSRGLMEHSLVAVKLFSQEDHLDAKSSITDLLLDTYPYGAHSTAADLMYSGLPMLSGGYHSHMASSVGGGMLSAAGIQEPEVAALLPQTRKGYEDAAVSLTGEG